LAVDIGGTFTDIFLIAPDGRQHARKILSSPGDYSRAVVQGVGQLLSDKGIEAASVREVLHGTTVVTNTCIELTGAKVGLITTRGFRDVLEIGRGRMPRLYDLTWTKPPPLVPRRLRFEVDERIDRDGRVVQALGAGHAEAVVDDLLSQQVESIAVCLFNSPLNPSHEQQIGELIRRKAPGVHLSLSTQVMPLLKEYERTCETVVNAYVMPVVADYVHRLKRRLVDLGIDAPLLIMQSNGGMITAEASAGRPVEIVECGPAGGVVGAAHLAKSLGFDNLITLDLGGTTCKASIVERGQFTRSAEYEVGAGIHMSSRLRKGKGHVLRVPSIDIAEIGAGGGSVVWLDSGGLLHVGPRSAGADPGPACYGQGGTDPCLTDCYLALGYLSPDHLLGGGFALDAEKSHQALKRVSEPLGMTPIEAAHGAFRIANSNMTRAITAVSSERGRDPRKFVLLAFGGAGALHAAQLAKELGIGRTVVAPYAGVFSAFGFACADIERYRIQNFSRAWDASVLDELNDLFDQLTEEAVRSARDWAKDESDTEIIRSADLRYLRQASELSIPLSGGRLTDSHLASTRERFDQEHERTFGHSFPDTPLEAACVGLVSRIRLARPELPDEPPPAEASKSSPGRSRNAYFGEEVGFVSAPVVAEPELSGNPTPGPVLVDRYDTTIVVPPGCSVCAAAGGSLNITTDTDGS